MLELRRTVARLILAVFLVTVLSPSFGWDMLSGEIDQDHAAADMGHSHDSHNHEHDHGPHHAGHDRAGHLLSHMPATVGMPDMAPTPLPNRQWYSAVLPIVLPEFLNDLLRPPKVLLLV
jgi:hypothetical protein